MRRGRTLRGRAGFTLIEVMVAVGLMTVGALAIMAMQQASTRGNVEARQIGTATEITSRWVERLRRDALAWSRVGTTVTDLGGGPLGALARVGAGGTTGWFLPPDRTSVAGDIGPAFDWLGLPVANTAATLPQIRYCTYLQLTWVRQGATARADVLTWWHRRGAGGDRAISDVGAFDCVNAAEATVLGNLQGAAPVLRSVRGSTLLRWTRRTYRTP